MDSSPNFNKKALDNKFNNDKKPFLASLPVNSKINLFFVVSLSLCIVLSLVLIKIPTKTEVFGKIINKTKSEFIIFNKENDSYYIDSINVKKNELIQDNSKPIITLNKFNQFKNNNSSKHSETKLTELNKEINNFENQYNLEIESIMKIIRSQENIIELTEKSKINKIEQLTMFSESYKNGNVSKEKYNSKLNEISDIEINISQLKKELEQLNLNLLNLKKEKKEKTSYIRNIIFQIKQDDIVRSSNNNIEIYSPCLNCKVMNIMVKEGDLINNTSPIISIDNMLSSKEMHAEIYIETKKYSNIKINSVVRIQLDAFPYLKHGTLEGEISYISESPIILDNGEKVFLAQAKIIKNKKNINLHNGMTFKANIIKDEVPLYKFFSRNLL